MTVTRIYKNNDDYVGHSGDVKPLTGIGAGTKFTEIDTGAVFIWVDGTWEEDLTLIYAFSQALKQQ